MLGRCDRCGKQRTFLPRVLFRGASLGFSHLLHVVPEQRVVVEPHRAVLALDVGLARVLDGDVLEDLVEGEVEPAVRAVLPVVLPVEVRVDLARLVGAKVAAWGKQEQAKFCDLRRGISKAL